MKTASILKADLLDIIFEYRNKDYGAYPLRKYYHERLYKALGITLLFISGLSMYILLYKPNIVFTNPYIIPESGYIHPIPPKDKIPPPATPKQPIIQKALNAQIFTSIIKVVDSTDRTIKPLKNLDSAVIANVNSDGKDNIKQVEKTPAGPETSTTTTNEPLKLIDKTKALATAEIMPIYPGGEEALVRFLQKNLQNPQDLEQDEIVSVKIKFIVGYDGVLKGFETVEDGGKAFNNEVIRVLKKMPAWIPGRTAGENVSVYYTIPVKFISQQ
ncbi:MAG: hypothetical protein ABI741_08995 [Ferruginibacter sp.]